MRWAGLAGSPEAPTTATVSVSEKMRASRSRRDASIAVASAPPRRQRPLSVGADASDGQAYFPAGGQPHSLARQAALDRMADEVMDVVIVGGGITGLLARLPAACASCGWTSRPSWTLQQQVDQHGQHHRGDDREQHHEQAAKPAAERPGIESAALPDRVPALRPSPERPDPGGRLLPLLLGLLAASLTVACGVLARRRCSGPAPARSPALAVPRGPRA